MSILGVVKSDDVPTIGTVANVLSFFSKTVINFFILCDSLCLFFSLIILMKEFRILFEFVARSDWDVTVCESCSSLQKQRRRPPAPIPLTHDPLLVS